MTQFGRCKVKIESNDKIKICSFSVVLGNGQALLGNARYLNTRHTDY